MHEEALDGGEVVNGEAEDDKKQIFARLLFREVLCNRGGRSLSSAKKGRKNENSNNSAGKRAFERN